MVEQWGELVQNDTIIGPFFVKSNMIKIKATQKRILTMLLTQDAIPEKDAKTIGMAHSKLRLTNDHFDRMLGKKSNLIIALFRKAFIDTGASLDLSKEAINCIEKSRSLVVSESSKKCDWAE